MASEHCQQTSDFLSYWPGLASGISTIAEKLKKRKTNDVTDNLNEEDVNIHIHTTGQERLIQTWLIRSST